MKAQWLNYLSVTHHPYLAWNWSCVEELEFLMRERETLSFWLSASPPQTSWWVGDR
jgi:hypothetical protein